MNNTETPAAPRNTEEQLVGDLLTMDGKGLEAKREALTMLLGIMDPFRREVLINYAEQYRAKREGAANIKLTVILRNDRPLIHCGDSLAYRRVQVDLTPEQVAAIAPRKTGSSGGQDEYESISKAFIEPNGYDGLCESPEDGGSVCHAKIGHHDDPRPHHCLLTAGHDGRHFCHICGLYWNTPNDQSEGSERSGDSLPSDVRWSEQQQTWVEDVWETCPLHELTRGASANCKLCKGAGEVLIEVECDPANAELGGVYDNTTTLCRERYDDGVMASSLPCDESMRNNKHFPWGCFGDVPPNTTGEAALPAKGNA